MRVITKIARQKNNPERYNIYLNEEYAFPVDEAILLQFGLTKGKVLDEFEIQEMAYEDEIRKAFNKALNFLSYQMRSEHEVKKKLLTLEFGEAVILEAIQKLKSYGFLNDETYSKALLDTKKATMKKGPKAIRQDLMKKGIDKTLQDEVLATYSFEEQVKLASQLADKVVRSEKKKTPTQIKAKIQDFLLRKGYNFSVVEEVLSQIVLEQDEDNWQQLLEGQGEKVWKKYVAKYDGYELKMKVKQALYQKGFPIEIIDSFIEQKEQEQ
ncbi:recombination regulator RecX [Lysinibacillus piscis]|uniref:Regulatory protein RecX n=1 Tax=Lysinibacillus piscis TaxID=2518931 RepID=A0ABQ5NQL1_9BACI|nr:recombination regulator RecX [Lysinibacillus sp. KH24]GLC90304.1 regulatory protein RecX [Lysinibacillus sp. KH24]